MAHCGSRGLPWHTDYTPTFIRMAREYEHCYGDTSALNLPTRWYALQAVVRDKVAREKLIHGSDWPILPLPCPAMLGWDQAFELLIREPNWLRRDVLIKRGLGMDDAYWHRAAKVLRLAGVAGVQQAVAARR
jgi:predicted TIM-barrel fold metal-dependent hydrolase